MRIIFQSSHASRIYSNRTLTRQKERVLVEEGLIGIFVLVVTVAIDCASVFCAVSYLPTLPLHN
jgi:hypothetical protein